MTFTELGEKLGRDRTTITKEIRNYSIEMCIRDSSITEPVEQIEAAVASLRKGELSNVEMLTYESEDELGGTITVSYTHLDVYKRQVQQHTS